MTPTAIYDLMIEVGTTMKGCLCRRSTRVLCQVSRRSVPYVEGGPAPADDYNDIWDVVVPGGVDDTVRVSPAAILLQRSELRSSGEPLLVQDPLLDSVYTITAIGQDRLKYIARITMVAYGFEDSLRLMAVWIDPAIEFIVREAHQDMGTFYQEDKDAEGRAEGLQVVPCSRKRPSSWRWSGTKARS